MHGVLEILSLVFVVAFPALQDFVSAALRVHNISLAHFFRHDCSNNTHYNSDHIICEQESDIDGLISL